MASYLNLLMYSKKFPNVFGGHLITMNIPSPRSDEDLTPTPQSGKQLCLFTGIRLFPLLRSRHKNPPPPKVHLAIHLMLYNGKAHVKDIPKMQGQTWVLSCGRPPYLGNAPP
jgi:hypothetical protein